MFPGNGRSRCRLRHFQAQDDAPLLSLAGKHSGGLAIQQQLQIFPVGTAEALPGPELFGLAGFEQGRQAARLKLSRIPQGEPFSSPGKLLIIGAGQRSQLCKVRPPPLLDGLALEGKLLVQHFQQGCFFRIGALRRSRRAAQQRVFLLQGPDIAAVDGQVAGVKLAEGSVQKFSPPLRRALDQAQMPGVKDDSRKTACQACGPLGRCPVYRGCPARAWGIRCADGQADTGRVIRLLFVFLCTLGGRFQYRERFAPAHQLGILAAPEALAAGEQPDGLQQVRLALAVVAAEDGQLPAGGKAGGSDVPVILDFK